jgi:hypothetical protein
MTSPRKTLANRENARRSTGPRSLASKARSAQNSTRHGLAAPLLDAPETRSQLKQLTKALAGLRRDPVALEQARIAAEAELELQRVRTYRSSVLGAKTSQMAQSRAATSLDSEAPSPGAEADQQIGRVVCDSLPDLTALERYEQRALSRRRRAMTSLLYTAVLFST